MNNDFNPLDDLISSLNLDKLQDDTINIISTLARESERNLNAIWNCIQSDIVSNHDNFNNDNTNNPVNPKTDSNVNDFSADFKYECPFPQRTEPIPMDDICPFPEKNLKSNVEINESLNKDNVMKNSKKSNPPLEENSNSTQEKSLDDTVDTSKPKKNLNVIDPFSPLNIKPKKSQPKDNKPLTDREVIDKTSSMWKYNPIGDTLELYPEFITETGSTPYADIVASRVRGKKHKHNATNCDDYFNFSLVGNCCVVAVSDGAGSKVYSRIGAKEVTTAYVKAMENSLENLLQDSTFLEGLSYPVTDALFNKSCSKVALELQNSVKSAYSSLVCKFDEISKDERYSKALDREVTINDLSCTMLSAIIIPLETENGVETFVATLQIGDGLICSLDTSKPFDSATKMLGVSDSGNFSGETEFITANGMMEQSNLMRRIRVMKGKTSAVILTTDGVADDYFPNESKSCNLYNDLILNGVIPIDVQNDSSIKIVPPIREQKTIEENPKDVYVGYCEDIQDFFKISDETLWNDKSYIENAISVYSQYFSENRGENLQSWLDNYTKRGSFDDRTLFLYRPIK